jgi:hypothetical protein
MLSTWRVRSLTSVRKDCNQVEDLVAAVPQGSRTGLRGVLEGEHPPASAFERVVGMWVSVNMPALADRILA